MHLGRAAARILTAYQRLISPWYAPCCRFVPSCSQYAKEALEIHGLGRGSLLAVRRLLRCHPLCAGGVDPVPSPQKRV
ncbi:MAG: hypothetical protein JG774_1075 [Desulfomicrobiaceae bacterium]|jgi:putative membrane protein insertion efficiency factor|nr:hypothetical protein [Desulfomicrobiaceae bacterium]MDI3492958.1 uncharacterized protein [Desulfomicrobiaceae bacterium]HCF06395.1 membrane protein insertion efficiency factor YidD [Desulfomicrobiaceae bacterium]